AARRPRWAHSPASSPPPAPRPRGRLSRAPGPTLPGRSPHRRPPRHSLGRLFATTASTALGLAIYDTQCGAKLFRATPEVMALFAEPFATRWIFDVELLGRLVHARRGRPLPQPDRVISEFPLMAWPAVAGSDVRL